MKYKKNFITNVICRVDFPEILKLKTEEPKEFQDEIRKEFPRFEKDFHPEEIKGTKIEKYFYTWKFFDKEKDKSLNLSCKHLVLEFFKYDNFEEFKKLWERIFSLTREIYKIDFFTRLGVRFINKIELRRGNALDWNGYISGKLISNHKHFTDWNQNIVRAMHQLAFNRDEIKIIINYGIFNEDYPNHLTKKQFVLDYDCYTDFEIDSSKVKEKISEHHKIIYDLFENSIGSKSRKIMGERNE